MFPPSLISLTGTMTLAVALSACGTPTHQQVGVGTGAVVAVSSATSLLMAARWVQLAAQRLAA